MAVTSHVYTKCDYSMGTKLTQLATDALKVMLLSAYTLGTTQNSAQFVSDVLAAPATEATGTGYTAGGQALTGVTLTNAGLVTTLTCANPSWNAAGGSLAASYALFYDSSPGTNATNPVLCYWDLGGVQTATNATFTLTISGTGVITWTAA
jgi:hypothetical protein